MRHISIFLFSLIFVLASTSNAAARKRGGRGAFTGGSFSIGAGLALSTAEQSGMNSMITAAKAAAASSASNMSSGTEYLAYATFRFANGFTAIQLRPSLFSQNSSGSGTDGSHEYDLSGYTIFPLARIIPLSNDFIDFYIQGGLGYAKLDGKVRNGTREAKFSGSAFGVQLGLGSEFCFIPQHCFNVEGNYRYLPIARNIVSSGTGPGNLPHGTSQAQPDRELEDLNGDDVATTLSGVSGLVSYTFNF
jgi:hypothetical protein